MQSRRAKSKVFYPFLTLRYSVNRIFSFVFLPKNCQRGTSTFFVEVPKSHYMRLWFQIRLKVILFNSLKMVFFRIHNNGVYGYQRE